MASTPRPTPPPARAPLELGFNAYTTPQTVERQRAVGATVTRLFVNWWGAEPLRGAYNWGNTDLQYKQILAGGLKPLIVPFVAPCWTEPYSGCNPVLSSPPNPAYDRDWSAFVRQLAIRYPKAVGIEVWSEPNLASNFYPQADPKRYTQLLKEAYAAVKSVNAAMPVILGGVLMGDHTGVAAGGYASQTFLEDVFADGAARWIDALGIHVYPADTLPDKSQVWDTAAMSRWLAQAEAVERDHGVPDLPIWITEMGVSTTTEPGFPAALTPSEQAADLVKMIELAKADPRVRVAMIDTLQDANVDPAQDLVSDVSGSLFYDDVFFNQIVEGLGIFRNDWTAKPAACAVSREFSGPLHC